MDPSDFSQRDIYVHWMMYQEELPTDVEFDAGMEEYEKNEEISDIELGISPSSNGMQEKQIDSIDLERS